MFNFERCRLIFVTGVEKSVCAICFFAMRHLSFLFALAEKRFLPNKKASKCPSSGLLALMLLQR